MSTKQNAKSLEPWIWDAACSIRGAKDAPKFKDFILPLIFTKRLCDVFDDELEPHRRGGRLAREGVQARQARQEARPLLPAAEPKNPDEPVWSVIRTLSDKIGEQLTTHLRAIADANPLLKGIIDRVDFNATTHGQRDIDDDRLSNLIEAISAKRLGLKDVEPDIIGRSYEYLIRKFAEGSGPERRRVLHARRSRHRDGADHGPRAGHGGLRPVLRLGWAAHQVRARAATRRCSCRSKTGASRRSSSTARKTTPSTWAMANMNMIIHDMEGEIEIGDTFRNPKFRKGNRLQTFDRVVANPMWNQTEFKEKDYDADELDRFPKGAGYPGRQGRLGLDAAHPREPEAERAARPSCWTPAPPRAAPATPTRNKERDVRQWFVEQDLIEGVIYLPENLFYNTTAPGIIIVLNRAKPKERQGKLFLLNASRDFVKGDPKNYLPEDAIDRIASTFSNWTEVEKLSCVVSREELAKNDFNISPSRY